MAETRTKLQSIAQSFEAQVIFTGGPPEYFETAGRLQLATLVREGIYPDSKLLDIGCGCLRGGYWLIHFLNPGCYCGIEPNTEMLRAGAEQLIEPEVLEEKQPRFDHNDRFDFSVFGEKFDIVLARSIWSHASKPQIVQMLDAFREISQPDAFFLTSYYPTGFWKRRDYRGLTWKGRSHQSDRPGQVCHSFGWIREEVEAREMSVETLQEKPFNGQQWLKISRRTNSQGFSAQRKTLHLHGGRSALLAKRSGFRVNGTKQS